MRVYRNRGRPVNSLPPFFASVVCFRSLGTLQSHPHFWGSKTFPPMRNQGQPYRAGITPYFCLTAMAEISTRALLTRAAAWMVARAGFGSGIRFL